MSAWIILKSDSSNKPIDQFACELTDSTDLLHYSEEFTLQLSFWPCLSLFKWFSEIRSLLNIWFPLPRMFWQLRELPTLPLSQPFLCSLLLLLLPYNYCTFTSPEKVFSCQVMSSDNRNGRLCSHRPHFNNMKSSSNSPACSQSRPCFSGFHTYHWSRGRYVSTRGCG